MYPKKYRLNDGRSLLKYYRSLRALKLDHLAFLHHRHRLQCVNVDRVVVVRGTGLKEVELLVTHSAYYRNFFERAQMKLQPLDEALLKPRLVNIEKSGEKVS